MENARAGAVQHVRVIEARIDKQKALVEQLKASGEDATEQIGRLKLLKLALEEMIIHCGRLTPSSREVAHAKRTALFPSARKRG